MTAPISPTVSPAANSERDVYQVRMLASGSSGNAIFVRIGSVKLLVDVGISRRRITNALREIGQDLDTIDAVILTHEHVDHVNALRKIRQKCPEIPIYSTTGTARGCWRRKRWRYRHHTIEAGVPFEIGGVEITPFAISHDALEPVGFRIETERFAVGIATDLGCSSDEVERALRDCHVLIVEANHDVEMLWNGPYPRHLKHRVVSNRGHLSNEQARELLDRVAGPRLQQVILGHMSEKNNTAAKVMQAVGTSFIHAPEVDVVVAERKTPSPLMSFEPCDLLKLPVPAAAVGQEAVARVEQLSLF